jgi:hypothetical protein
MRATFHLLIALFLLAPALGDAPLGASQPEPMRSGAARTSASVEPKEGWEKPRCSKLADALKESLFGAFAGLLVMAIPALLLAFTRFRKYGIALAVLGVVGGACIMGWLYWGLAPDPVCGSYNTPTEIDAHVDSDSLYRLWTRFAVEQNPDRQDTLATAILCERHRLARLEPWGLDAITLAQSRVAPRDSFEHLNAHVHSLIGNPEPGPLCHFPGDGDSGRALRAEPGS